MTANRSSRRSSKSKPVTAPQNPPSTELHRIAFTVVHLDGHPICRSDTGDVKYDYFEMFPTETDAHASVISWDKDADRHAFKIVPVFASLDVAAVDFDKVHDEPAAEKAPTDANPTEYQPYRWTHGDAMHGVAYDLDEALVMLEGLVQSMRTNEASEMLKLGKRYPSVPAMDEGLLAYIGRHVSPGSVPKEIQTDGGGERNWSESLHQQIRTFEAHLRMLRDQVNYVADRWHSEEPQQL